MGLLTDPLASQAANSPEDRHEANRTVTLRLWMLAEAGTATATMAPRRVMSAIALAILIIFPPPTEPRSIVMLRPGHGEWQGYKTVWSRDIPLAERPGVARGGFATLRAVAYYNA